MRLPPRYFAAAFFEVPQGKHSARKVWPYSATASRNPSEEAPLYPCRAPGLLDIRVASTGALIPMGEATRMPELDPDSAKGDLVFELPPPYQNHPRAIFLSTASPARSPASQAPPTVPHKVSCTASPANQRRSRSGSDSALRAPDRLLHLGTIEAGEPVERKRHHCRPSLRGETGPEPASHIQSMLFTGVENWIGRPAASLASNVPTPSRQEALTSRSADLARSIADTSSRSLPHPKGPSTNSIVARQSPRSLGSTCAQETSVLPRAAFSIARLQRTRFAKKSSISPSRAYRSGRCCGSSWGRPRSSRWLGGAA